MLHQTVTSLAVAERTGMLVRREEDHNGYVTQCPACRQILWLLEHGALCENSGCHFFAGSPLDLLKFQEGLADYALTVRRMDDLFADRVPSRQLNPAFSDVLEARARRSLLEVFLRAHASQLEERPIALTKLDSWLRSKGFRSEAIDLSIFILPVKEVDLLNQCAVLLGFQPVDTPATPVIALPTFDAYHSVASVLLYNPHTRYKEVLDLQTSRFSFFGLLHHTPRVQRFYITGSNSFEAGLANSQLALLGPKQFATAVRFKAEMEAVRFLPETAIYISPRGGELGLAEQLQQQSTMTLFFSAAGVGEDPKPLRWMDFLLQTLLRGTDQHGRLTSPTRLMLASLQLDTHTRQWLVQACRQMKRGVTAGDLMAAFQTNLVYSTDKLKLYATPDGYQLVKGNGGRDLITNFVLDLKSNVCFRESGALFYYGELSLDGLKSEVVIPAGDLESAATLEALLQRRVVQTAPKDRPPVLPIIHDRTGMKQVSAHLRESSVRLPQREGIDRLGWSMDKKAFYGTSWKTDMEGTTEHSFCLHPGMPVLENFSAGNVSLRGLCKAPENEILRTLIAMAVAGVARSYLNYPTHGVLVRQDNNIQPIIERLFRGIGQTRGLVRSGSEIYGVQGYPVYGYGYNLGQLSRAGLPMFSLSESGIILSGRVTDVELEEAIAFLPQILVQVAEWLLGSSGEGFARRPHVMHATELMEEGSWLMREVADVVWEFSYTAFASIEKLLSNTKHSELGRNWRYDFTNQKVVLSYDKLPVDVAFLEAELRNLSQQFEHVPSKKMMTMDGSSMLGLLRHYYGKDAGLPLITTPPK